ncbi:YycH family regulatory protein [Neobacillus sp. SM06]|uniref:YycH family regulatory protein n=1 Tax=Neobacillus sp. SM06 TaxID=3422492 RepID=UPI003D29F2D3
MRYEKIKSIVLTVLVFGSIFLTWNLWTYQPNYDTMENSNYVAQVTLSQKREVKKIVRPDIALYHIKGEHFGTVDPAELDRLTKELSRWVFTDVKNVTSQMGNINQLTQANGNVEIAFPTDIPIDLYRNVLHFQEKKILSFNFDKMIVNVENPEKDNGVVYFVSTNTEQVYASRIAVSFLNEFIRDFYKGAWQYPHYFAYNRPNKPTLFLPDKDQDMMEYKYLPVTLNSDEFKEALFNDPSFVQKSFVSQGEEYTNGSSKMNINYDRNMLLYVNPTVDSDFTESTNDLVKRSIDFVNEHGGWTDSYRYVEKDELQHKVTFRMYSDDGYPVFNDSGMSEINETWGRREINKYVRPNISLELPLKSEMKKIKFPSGSRVLNYLLYEKKIKPELLEKIVLGYKMKRDTKTSKLILLEPTWFYRYDKTWNEVTMADLGGAANGLE